MDDGQTRQAHPGHLISRIPKWLHRQVPEIRQCLHAPFTPFELALLKQSEGDLCARHAQLQQFWPQDLVQHPFRAINGWPRHDREPEVWRSCQDGKVQERCDDVWL